MSKYDKIIEKLEQDAVILQYVKTIQKEDLVLPEWFELNEDYKTTTHSLAKVIITIRNSILFQKRIFFCITRKSLRELIESDINWGQEKGSFKNEKYSYIIKLLTQDFQIMKLVQKAVNKRSVDVYQLTDESLLKHLKIDESKQLEQTISFANKFNNLNIGDRKGDQVVSSKEKVVSISSLDKDTFLDILSLEDTSVIIQRLKGYKCNYPNKWKEVIRDNCSDIKANEIIKRLNL